MSFIEVEDIQSLQIGTWVKLEGSWFSHPFPTNTFTIKSSEDLATIKGLTNVTILYDPERSQPVSSDDISNGSDDEVGVPTELVDAEVTETFSNGGEEARHEEEALIPESALSELLDRREDYHEFYDHLRKVEGAYQKTLSQGQELFQQLSGRRPAGLKTGDTLITNIMQALNNPKTAMSLIDLVGSNGVAWGLSEHAINVCTLSLLIGRQFSLEDEVLLELGRGALFHDAGYRALPMKVKFQAGGMKVEADPELRLLHPEMGGQLMASFLNAGPLLVEIIAQHHERLDGSGFPKGLGREDLSLLTRIVMVADHYDELCNAPNPETSLNPHAALSRLYRHVVMKGESSKFCERVVQALVQAIGVYPPGSLVELSDGFMGIVSSINVHQPTKPIVSLYAPWLCRNDGLLVNLAHDAKLEIKRAVHAKDIPEQVLAYLSPRRLAMFVHAAEPITMGFNSRRTRSLKPALKH
jgi:HD-GYP domain-containing protein (c-di-GMP phosphodiesterase class II)